MNKSDRNYIDKIRKRAVKTILKYGLVKENDHVLIGLSGGKDSLALLDVLAYFQKRSPFNFRLSAAHVSALNFDYEADMVFLENKCLDNNISFQVQEITIDLNVNKKKSPCFVCSWARRKELFRLTKELHCNKLALGHHMDDAIETLLLNMMYHGSISSLPEKLSMLNGRIHIIRPLLHILDYELKEYALIEGFNAGKGLCKYAAYTKRENIRGLLEEMQRIHPKSKINLFRSMYKTFPEYLPENPENLK